MRVITRRRVLATSAAAGQGALALPWGVVFAQPKPYRIGTMQPLSGAPHIGKTALVGVQMAVDRINQSGGINGRSS